MQGHGRSQLQEFKTKLGPEYAGTFYLWLAVYRDSIIGRTTAGQAKRVGTIMAACLSGRVCASDTIADIGALANSHFGPGAAVPPGNDRTALDAFAERITGAERRAKADVRADDPTLNQGGEA